MRRWKTAPVRVVCGYCGAEIQKGEVYAVIVLPAVKREHRRCVECAGEAPRDVDAGQPRPPALAHPLFTLARAAEHHLLRDGKRLASEPREPGEEG